jgi:hypothetical protein
MNHLIRVATALLAVAIFLAGCAAPEIPYDRASAGGVRTIGIVTPSFPTDPVVVLASSVGQSFGLVGALVDAGMQSNREAQFRTILQRENFSARDCFIESLTARLQERGYVVSLVPVTRTGTDFLTQYPTGTEPAVDAYLDLVALSYGYVAAGIGSSTPYRPQFAVRARLVSAKDSSVLVQDRVIYNPIGTPGKTVTIAPEPAHQFRNFNTLVADPAKAVVGLKTATERSAETLSALLR